MIAISRTDIGNVRKVNQDTVYCSDKAVGVMPNLYIVADGMGGEKAGDYASKTLVDEMIKFISKHKKDKPITTILNSINHANTIIYKKSTSDEKFQGMGTTLIAAFIDGNTLYTLNIGDSRLYIYNHKDNMLTQVSKDHSFVEEMVSIGAMKKGSADYLANKNKITRAVGSNSNVSPDIFDNILEKGDVVIMCSDGLTNMIDDSDIRRIIVESDDLNIAADSLISLAKKNGGKDNISLILIPSPEKEVE